MTINEFRKLDHDYLGDGAYICNLGHCFVVITTNGISIQNEIHLGSYEIKALNNFVKKCNDA